MRRFLLLTVAFAVSLAVFATALPHGGVGYVEGVDDGPPEIFKDLESAERAAGYRLPRLQGMPRWKFLDASVVPVNFTRRVMAERRALTAPESGSFITFSGPTARPMRGLHSYASAAYESSEGLVTFTFGIRAPRLVAERFKQAGVEVVTERTRVNGTRVVLSTIRAGELEILSASWVVGGLPVIANVVKSPSTNDDYQLSRDEFLALIAAMR